MRRLAMLSYHTSPLAQPGVGDGGGMNVYVKELSSALARAGATCDVFTRSFESELPRAIEVEPGLRVHHIPAGPAEVVPRDALPTHVEEFTVGVLGVMATEMAGEAPFEAVHAHYWLSGQAGHAIKHALDLPLVSTFHTLDRVKAEAGREEAEIDLVHRRSEAEAAIVNCSDAIVVSCSVEADQVASLYGADRDRLAIVPPGVDHTFFGPGHRPAARKALGIPTDGTLLLFVGRLQPLKGADVAVATLGELRKRQGSTGAPYRLMVVGGPSGAAGAETVAGLRALIDREALGDVVTMVPPQPHELLSTYYRAADVCLVPSKSESFGLVALEAAACGTPVVASAVGGLLTLVDDGKTGYLAEVVTAASMADRVEAIVSEPLRAERFGTASVLAAREYTWRGAAAALGEVHDEIVTGGLVECTA